MSAEQNNDKAITDDEKFINGLYAELASELANLPDEQPSELLDERILVAAYQAVDLRPKTVKTSVEKLPKVKKSRAWHIPLSLAASTVLVVSLVVNQREAPLLPKESTLSEPVVVQSDMQYERVVSINGQAVPERKIMIKNKGLELTKQRNRQVEKMANVPIRLANKNAANTESELFSAAEGATAASQLMQTDHALADVNSNYAGLKKQLSASRLAENSIIPWLSPQQYLSYRELNNQCKLLNDTEGYYLIGVYIAEKAIKQYKLKKPEFNIIRLSKEAESKFLFEQITLANKK